MDKFTETYLKIISEASEDDRYLLKVGEKFASSPPTKLTANPNLAGVIHGMPIAKNLIRFYKSMHYTDEEIELIPWEDRDKVL